MEIKKTILEKKFYLTAASVDAFSFILYHIFSLITIKNYIVYNTMIILVTFIFALSNYICIYGIKLISLFVSVSEEENYMKNNISSSNGKNEFFYKNRVSVVSYNTFTRSDIVTMPDITNKVLDINLKNNNNNSNQILNVDISEYIK